MSTTHTPAPAIDRAAIRRRFPALASETAFLENAGGSQVPAVVADAIRDYMLTTYVQLEAGYPESKRADATVAEAHAVANLMMNGTGAGEVVLGPSTTQLVTMLAGCYGSLLEPGDEVIVAEMGHEANVGPWTKLAERGVEVRFWRMDPNTHDASLESLAELLNARTRVVAMVHVSNLLGHVVDVKAAAALVHERSPARVVVDGVAYAPHRAVDVRDLGVDWYVHSTYKVYGPHMAALWGRHDALAELTGPNHFFIARDEVPYKFELGGACHEGCAGIVALGSYLRFLAELDGAPVGAPVGPVAGGVDRATIARAYAVMERCERPLQQRLLEHLADVPSVTVLGRAEDGPDRVSTVSFVHESLSSAEIVAAAHARGVAIRRSHNYAYRLCEALGVDVVDGPVRVSAVHYNTPEEIERAIAAIDEAL